MVFPDPIDKPCRTIITGEGGSAPSRFKHVIIDPKHKKLRRLTPIELERANMFPDNHTGVISDITDQKRAFFMGNALVVGVIEKIGVELGKMVK
jgi:DNA (cytosine-5)-methyltransferase 1